MISGSTSPSDAAGSVISSTRATVGATAVMSMRRFMRCGPAPTP